MSSTAATRPVAGPGLHVQSNSRRLETVKQRLRGHIQAGAKSETKEFQELCVSLAKSIDFAITNNETPNKLDEFPLLIKQVCKHRNDAHTMVLMISVKHACQLRWFSDSECRELIALHDEMRNNFGSRGNTSPGIKSREGTVSQIMERFYPFVKLGHVLVSLEVKAGFTMLAHDFHISKNMPCSLPREEIQLFVAQIDNIDTSACIVNPSEVSFLVNGKPIEKRVNISMDSGPQLPTVVTSLVKYGINLLQVMGNFKGHYIIIIASMGAVLPPEKPVLKHYLQSETIEASPDSDIIEGPSRVSLNCPISRRRIRLPVKGQLCKHLQCFDFLNYVYINMRNPLWRCPHCNQPVCYPEIRLDQNMVKILKDAGKNAADVVIHAGGTWKVAKENGEKEEPVCDVIIHDLEDPTSFLNSGPDVLDLTGDDDAEIELSSDTKVEDRKPRLSVAQGQSNNENASKDASDDDYFSIFNLFDVISLDQAMLDQLSALGNTLPQPHQTLNTGTGQESQISMPRDPVSSPRDTPATTSTVFTAPNPSPQFSQVHVSPVTPTGTYLGRTSSQRWNQTYPSQPPSVTTSSQSRMHPVPVTGQSPANVSSFGQSSHIPRVLSSQPICYRLRALTSNLVTSDHVSGPTVQSVTRTSDHVSTQRQYHPSGPAVQSVARTSDHVSTQRQHPSGPAVQPVTRTSDHVSTQRQHHPNGPAVQSVTRTSDHVSTQRQHHPNGPAVQSIARTSDLMDVDSATPDTTNWRPKMRGSITPGSYSPALDQMIIRPTQQSQTGSQPVQAPPVQTSQAQPPFSTASPGFTSPSGPTSAPWRT